MRRRDLASIVVGLMLLIPATLNAWQGEVIEVREGALVKVRGPGADREVRLYGTETPRHVLGVKHPAVGLMSNGEEDEKGLRVEGSFNMDVQKAVEIRSLVKQSRGRWHEDSALEVLKRRYAQGEISKEEYEGKRADLT